MALDIPDGARCFVDANILYYALVPTYDTSENCLTFLDRAIAGHVRPVLSTQVLSDVLHKVMTSEVAQRTGRNRSGMVGYLKKHPEVIADLIEFPQTISRLRIIPMDILSQDADLLDEAARIASTYLLLMNDAAIIALMRRHGITHLATNDDDFDRVAEAAVGDIHVWKPR